MLLYHCRVDQSQKKKYTIENLEVISMDASQSVWCLKTVTVHEGKKMAGLLCGNVSPLDGTVARD